MFSINEVYEFPFHFRNDLAYLKTPHYTEDKWEITLTQC